MKHKLIIIDGHSTVGKSSLSKSVYKQICNQDTAYWLHEECENHPIRDGEFEAGDIYTLEGMKLNMKLMIEKWGKFAETVQGGNKICVLEGCFLHSLDRFILQSVWQWEEINNYFEQIMNVLMPLNPFIIFLYRPDIIKSFEKAFIARGDWWRDLILGKPEPYGYFKNNEYTGDESIYKSLLYEQEQMEKVFNLLPCDKLKVDTTNEQWDKYLHEIVHALGYKYKKQKNEMPPQINKYCGTYKLKDGEYNWKINYDEEKKSIYTSLFWPYMPMCYLGDNMYELISFPVTLHFVEEKKMKFTVSGNYDWKFNGKTFIKINE